MSNDLRCIAVEMADGSVEKHDVAQSFAVDEKGCFVYDKLRTIAFYPTGQFVAVRDLTRELAKADNS